MFDASSVPKMKPNLKAVPVCRRAGVCLCRTAAGVEVMALETAVVQALRLWCSQNSASRQLLVTSMCVLRFRDAQSQHEYFFHVAYSNLNEWECPCLPLVADDDFISDNLARPGRALRVPDHAAAHWTNTWKSFHRIRLHDAAIHCEFWRLFGRAESIRVDSPRFLMACGPLAPAVEVWAPGLPVGAASLEKRVAALEAARSKMVADEIQEAEQGPDPVEQVDPAIVELDNMLAILDDVEAAGVDVPGIGDLLLEASLYLSVLLLRLSFLSSSSAPHLSRLQCSSPTATSHTP